MARDARPNRILSKVEHLAAGHAADARRAGEAGNERRAGLGRVSIPARISKAMVRSASPARIAVASSKALWTVGRPRRRSSSSMAGSRHGQAVGMDAFERRRRRDDRPTSAPKSPAHSMRRNGRSRFPPPSAA